MTDQELLQQAKDQVAEETAELLNTDWKNWSDLSYAMWNVPAHLLALSDRASKMAIQRAREEGKKEGYKIACRNNGIEEDPSGPYAMGPGM